MKVGRNDPCPCGSGVKYKKCCIPKYDTPTPKADNTFRDYESFLARAERLKAMSESEILHKLHELGIRTDKAQFIQEVGDNFSVENISEKWSSRLRRNVGVLDEEFPLLAARELWNRWLPDRFSLHGLESMIVDYLDHEPGQRVVERFWAIWAAIRDHYLLRYKCHSFEEFGMKTDLPFDMTVIFFDTEHEMIEECRNRQEEDPESWDRLILLYRDMLEHLTEMNEYNRLNLRRSMAEAYFYKSDYETAETLFHQLIDEHPEWAWGYIGWGDLYHPRYSTTSTADKDKALRLYRQGLDKVSSDRDALEERIGELSAL